jgi:5'(3')-deoxyribonucleotidase
MQEGTNSKPRVLVDLDGVIRDFITGLKNAYLDEYPEHSVKEITSRDLPKYFPIGEEINGFLEKVFNKILLQAPCYPGAIEALQKWEDNFHIVIVTAQSPQYRGATFSWIGNHSLPTDEVQITFDKHIVDGYALLDDFPENLDAFKETDRLAVCMDQPWNRNWKGLRVKSVNEFFELVQEHITNNK